MDANRDDSPVRLDYYAAPKRRLLPADPFAPARLAGMFVGFVCPFLTFVWDHWAENVIRSPLLWYQHEGWIFIVWFGAVGTTVVFIKKKFFSAFFWGALVGFLILGLNRMIEGEFFGVDLLGPISGNRI
jgi:hypothetical protein